MSFNLKNSKDEFSSVILYCQKNVTGPRFRYSTGKVIPVRFWEKKSQRVSIPKDTNPVLKSQLKRVNLRLEEMDTFLEKQIESADLHKIQLTSASLFSAFEKEFKLTPRKAATKTDTNDFYQLVDIFIGDSEKGDRIKRDGTRIKESRIKQYRSFKNKMLGFRKKVSISDIDMDFYTAYIVHRNKEKKAKNSIGGELNIFKAILTYTCKKGYHNNRVFENPDFVSMKEKVENVYLTDDELTVLWNLELTGRKAEIRDLFIVGCYTGLRIADLSKIKKADIGSDGLLKVITEKTGVEVYIPLHWRVTELMLKYGGEFPQVCNEQKLRVYIKEIAKKAEFKEVAKYRRTVGGVSKTYSAAKHQRISTHTARRTFATNFYLAGFDTLSIMAITGHTTEREFLKYVCVTKQQIAIRMQSNPYLLKPVED